MSGFFASSPDRPYSTQPLGLTEHSGTLEPKMTLGISAIAGIIERKAHGYLGAAPGGNTPELQALFGVGPRHRNRTAPLLLRRGGCHGGY